MAFAWKAFFLELIFEIMSKDKNGMFESRAM